MPQFPLILEGTSRTTPKVRRSISCRLCEHCAQRICGRHGGSADPAAAKKKLETILGKRERFNSNNGNHGPRLGFKLGRAHAVFKWRCGAISGTLCRVIHGAASSLADLWCKRVHAPVSGPTSRPTALQLPVDKCHPSAWLQLRLLRGLQVEPAPVTQSPAHCAVATLFLLRGSYCTGLTARGERGGRAYMICLQCRLGNRIGLPGKLS